MNEQMRHVNAISKGLKNVTVAEEAKDLSPTQKKMLKKITANSGANSGAWVTKRNSNDFLSL
jgi:hypothetical protein